MCAKERRVRMVASGANSHRSMRRRGSGLADGVDQLVKQVDVPLLRGDQLVLHELGAGRVDVVDAFAVVLQPVLLAFLEGFERAGVAAEERGGAFDELGPSSPGAG